MAFGFFKKEKYADIIYMNGHIYTQDSAFPWASAVACRDGKVLAVGDFEGMDEICGSDTEVIDLKEKYMFPGFIDVHGTPVLKTFEDMYLSIDPVWDLDMVLETLEDYVESTDDDVIFAYGYNEKILSDYDDPAESSGLLDEIESERAVMLLGTDGIHCWLNTAARTILTTAAEDEGVQYLTTDYALQVLSPFDFEIVENKVQENINELADKGITAFLDLCSPDYFSSLYRDSLVSMIGESETPKQRFFGSLYVNRPINPALIAHKLSTARTNCIELGGIVNFDFLKLEVSSDEELSYFSPEALNTICQSAADKGYNIHLDAIDREAEDMAREVFAQLRTKGCKQNTLILAGDDLDEDEDFLTTWPTDLLNQSVFSHSGSVSEAIDNLTINAAELLGKSKEFGSIEQGKAADFTIFEENPLGHDLRYFQGMHADMTIIDGEIVYDVEEENAKEIYDLLTSLQL